MPLRHRIFETARQRPEALAISLGETRLSYGALADKIARLNAALSKLTAHKRSVGVKISNNGRLMVLAVGNHPSAAPLLATALSSPHGIAVMDPQWPETQLCEALGRLPADIVFTTSDKTGLINAAVRNALPVILVDQDWAAFLDIEACVPALPDPQDTFLIGFTSGTTSYPKAFSRSRLSWEVSLQASERAFDLSKGMHTLAPGPLSHGLTLYAFAETLHIGAAFLGFERFSASAMCDALAQGDIKRVVAVPSMLEVIPASARFPNLNNVTTAGAKLPSALLGKAVACFPNAAIFEYYGASELGFVSVNRHINGQSQTGHDTVGRPFPHVDLQLRQNGKPVSATESGTIFVKGDLAIERYLWGDGTSGFRREGSWATVGDIGRIAEDGGLTLLGREGGMVLSGGYNIYPQEVEAALNHVAGIDAAVVVPVEDGFLGQKLMAAVQTSLPLDGAALFSTLREYLPAYKLPKEVFTCLALPHTTSGKIARGTVQKWITTGAPELVKLDTAP